MAEVTAQLAVGEGAFGGGKGDLAAQLPGGMVGAGVGEERLDLGARAIEAAGQDAVRDVLQRALAQFQDPRTSVVTLVNTFRWVAARRVS
jgi:hypothetical protein